MLVNEGERAAIRHTRLPLHQSGWLASWRCHAGLRALVQRERPSVAHAHGDDMLPHALELGRTARLPFLLDLTQPPHEPALFRRHLKSLESVAHRLRVPSAFMADHLVNEFGINRENISLVSPGIDLGWYNPAYISPERLQTLSRLWRLPEQAFVILVPMPLTPGAGHKTLLQALATMKNENIFAVLVGHDRAAPGLGAEIENSINLLGLAGKVIMPEFCTDWPAAFWLANVVAAANEEPRGQHVELLAAQAMGRAVIVTDCGANHEMVRRGETAWVVPSRNPRALAEALRDTLRLSTDQRLTLADNTRYFIDETFPQENWFNGFLGVYESLLRAPGAAKKRAA